MTNALAIISQIKKHLATIIVGQENMIEGLLIGLLNDGHILLEGPPGLAKTLAVSTLSKSVRLHFQRIQFTPDLLPADLIGTEIYNPKTGEFTTRTGPVFSNIVLADEINRAPPKVQSALLEAMQERQVTIGDTSWALPYPFLVLATQNPIEQEGTYPLPEAQADRFLMKVKVGYPTKKQEKQIVLRSRLKQPVVEPLIGVEEIELCKEVIKKIHFEEIVLEYIIDIVQATRVPNKYGLSLRRYISNGASVRATMALERAARTYAFLQGRKFVSPDDVKQMAFPVLRHRVLLTYEAEAEGISSDNIIEMILQKVPVP
jgi:MoxR-like ATPase